MLCCGYTLTDFPISIRLTSLALWQSNDCPSASKATLMNMDKYLMLIHYERLHNHNKAKHNKTVCIFLGIYCICWFGAPMISLQKVMWIHQFYLIMGAFNINWKPYTPTKEDSVILPISIRIASVTLGQSCNSNIASLHLANSHIDFCWACKFADNEYMVKDP